MSASAFSNLPWYGWVILLLFIAFPVLWGFLTLISDDRDKLPKSWGELWDNLCVTVPKALSGLAFIAIVILFLSRCRMY